MDMISLQGKTNFFERRVGDYQKAGVMNTKQEKMFRMDSDFWLRNLYIYIKYFFFFFIKIYLKSYSNELEQ